MQERLDLRQLKDLLEQCKNSSKIVVELRENDPAMLAVHILNNALVEVIARRAGLDQSFINESYAITLTGLSMEQDSGHWEQLMERAPQMIQLQLIDLAQAGIIQPPTSAASEPMTNDQIIAAIMQEAARRDGGEGG